MITGTALKRLASHRFRITSPREDGSHPLDGGFPLIVADHSVFPTCYTWRIPSVGDGARDLNLGRVMALGWLVYEAVADADNYQMVAGDILGALQFGDIGELQLEGFATLLFQFIDCTLNAPERFAAIRDRLKRMTDADLDALYLVALRGDTLPDFFAETYPDTP